jgi:hypothetical protein
LTSLEQLRERARQRLQDNGFVRVEEGADTSALLAFDPKQPRAPDGRWTDGPGGGLLDKLTHLTSFDDLSDDDVSALADHLEGVFGDLLDQVGYDRTDPPVGDRYLAKLAADRGFDGKPEVVDEVPDGPNLLARGLKPLGADPEEWANQFRTGQLFEGTGVNGHGTYVVQGEKAVEDAAWYASKGGVVLRMEPQRPLSSVSLPDLYRQVLPSIRRALDRGDLTDRQKKAIKKATEDAGRLATLLGYDEIEAPKSDVKVLLNRAALRVQRSSVRVTWESRAEPVIQPGPRHLDSDA